ncbi:MAG: NAD(P)-binding domain-containing protein [Ktedonobacteraceae bacterium]
MTISINAMTPQGSSSKKQYDVVVVGAGPYGLSVASHLLKRGLHVIVFGKPMAFWREHMPKGMLLRSAWWASNLSDPQKKYGLKQYLEEQGQVGIDPLSIETFIEYGQWFQRHAVPEVDETYVAAIERQDQHFEVKLVDGRTIKSSAVVMAPGLHYYVHRPREYMHLPPELLSHTADHQTFDQLSGKRVVVIGGGQSATETAALLYEADVDVKLVTRKSIDWLPPENTAVPYLIRQLRAPKVGLGYGWFNLALEKYPYTYHQLPRATKDHFLRTFHGPAGATWLKERVVGKVQVLERHVEKTREVSGRVTLTLSDNLKLEADHVILATGYQAEVKRLPMLPSSVLSALHRYMGSPILNNRFESSIPGLYFVGFSAARSFGPLFRFVVGTNAAAERVAKSIAQQVVQVRR